METNTTHKPITNNVIPEQEQIPIITEELPTSSIPLPESPIAVPQSPIPIVTQSPMPQPILPESSIHQPSPVVTPSPITVPQSSSASLADNRSRRKIKDDDDDDDIKPALGSEESINDLLSQLPLSEKNKIIKDLNLKQTKQEILARELHEDLYTPSTVSNYPDDTTTQTLYTAPILSREALLTDVAFRTFILNLNQIGDTMGIQINQSIELAHDWVAHISKLDQYIKSISSWKKTLTYSLCLITFGAFLWKIGALRALPQFLSNAISIIPMPTPTLTSNVIHNVDVPTPNLESTYKAIMDTPLTPLVFVSSIGAITTVVGIVRIVAWMLRKLPK